MGSGFQSSESQSSELFHVIFVKGKCGIGRRQFTYYFEPAACRGGPCHVCPINVCKRNTPPDVGPVKCMRGNLLLGLTQVSPVCERTGELL